MGVIQAGPGFEYVRTLRGAGPPKFAGGSSSDRGDLHYRFVIDVPRELNEEQSAAVDELSKVMNGDVRARLFAQARSSTEAGHGAS